MYDSAVALLNNLSDAEVIKSFLLAFLSTYAFSLCMDIGKTVLEVFFNFFRRPGQPPLQTLTPQECALVIPCHNSDDCIEATLETLPSEYKVFVVANACTDDTMAVLERCRARFPTISVLETEEPGKIRAVILGAIAAKRHGYNYFLLLDDDVEWPEFHGKPFPVTVYKKDKSITALPVVPSKQHMNWVRSAQSIEYQLMCASKRAQGNLGNVIMASGAAGIYNIGTFLEAMQDHDGEHIGDDLQCSYIHHTKGMKIDFNSECVVKTHPPGDLKAWWKQRARRWEVSPVYNLYWSMRIMLAPLWGYRNPGWWIRGIALYRALVILNDLLRCVSFPMVLIFSPWVLPGVWLITYCSVLLKMLVFMYFFQNESYVKWDKATAVSVLTYPFYGMMMWISRVWAIPKGVMLNFRQYLRGKRTKFSFSFASLEKEAELLDERTSA